MGGGCWILSLLICYLFELLDVCQASCWSLIMMLWLWIIVPLGSLMRWKQVNELALVVATEVLVATASAFPNALTNEYAAVVWMSSLHRYWQTYEYTDVPKKWCIVKNSGARSYNFIFAASYAKELCSTNFGVTQSPAQCDWRLVSQCGTPVRHKSNSMSSSLFCCWLKVGNKKIVLFELWRC